MLEHVRGADFSPDGQALAVIRRLEGRERLEYPLGHPLAEGEGLSAVRVSPSGEWLAFVVGSTRARSVQVIRRDGTGRKTLVGPTLMGSALAWSPDGREVWHSSSDTGSVHLSLYAVDLQGRRRTLAALPGPSLVLDVGKDGRALLSLGDIRGDIEAWAPGETRGRQLSWLEFPRGVILSADGKSIVFSEAGQGGGSKGSGVYARSIEGSPAVKLGEGWATDLSADGLSSRPSPARAATRRASSSRYPWAPASPGRSPRAASSTKMRAGSPTACASSRWPANPTVAGACGGSAPAIRHSR